MAITTHHRNYSAISLALLALLLGTSGCFWVTTKDEGNKLRSNVTDLQGRVGTQDQRIDKKMKKLQSVLDQATTLLARNSANIGDNVHGMENDLRRLRGLLNEVKRYTDELKAELKAAAVKANERDKVYLMKLADMDQRLMAMEAKAAGPQTAPDLYKAGKSAFDAGDYNTARGHFRRLVVRFGSDSRADDAQYYRAESYMREKSYERAIAEFQKIFDKYPKSSFADDAFFRAGEAAEKLKSCREARAYYGGLRARFPKSSLAKKAAARDRFLKRSSRNKKVCRNK